MRLESANYLNNIINLYYMIEKKFLSRAAKINKKPKIYLSLEINFFPFYSTKSKYRLFKSSNTKAKIFFRSFK